MTKPNQAEYDRAVAEIAEDPRIAAFRERILALFPRPGWPVSDPFKNGNHVFVWVNDCTRGWTPGTPANYVVGIYIPGLCYNGGGKTVEGAIRRADETFDDYIMEKVSGCIARMLGNNPYDFRAPHRATDWSD